MALLNVLYVQLGTRCVLGTNAMCKPHVGLEVWVCGWVGGCAGEEAGAWVQSLQCTIFLCSTC